MTIWRGPSPASRHARLGTRFQSSRSASIRQLSPKQRPG
ncbi:hypothetical protein USDA257_c02700 [Sinorhizobium fredii USDA 257]|uniref:Uncharacterized protein n=1 Tax=Sinorhizobium fredii (strain USDA 257) TaxID=1185652 RepID=I3WZ12_SINF2|nr:hypothetical protein USDA257_c02700 [Sinorhizobium fredii USDA 257]